jgi:hypothetical protein
MDDKPYINVINPRLLLSSTPLGLLQLASPVDHALPRLDVMAEIKLMPWRLPVDRTTGVSPFTPQVPSGVMIWADMGGIANIDVRTL